MNRILLLLFLGSGLFASGARSEEWNYTHPVTERDSFVSADFTLSLDPQIASPRGIIVLVGPQDVDMRESVRSSPWVRLAKQQNCAVLGCKFVNKKDGDFSRIDSGGRAALLACLTDFSKRSESLRDLDRLKLVLVGNLAGAQFVYEFANRESERVAGFVCINPYYFTIPPSGMVRKVPGFFLVTENEHPTAVANVTKLFTEQRKLGALWAMISWNSTTQTNLDGLMTVPFVEQALIVRIKRRNPIGVLESLGINDGWSLDLSQFSPPMITESRNVPRGQEERFAWFVSENLAEAVSRLMVKPAAGH